jgi:formylglycine-generating enzyme required for sulfatase activity
VGSYAPNKLGLYDMHGNVWQWCEDLYDLKASVPVMRGGSWNFHGLLCRAASRHWYDPSSGHSDVGVRLARVPSGGK